MWGASAASRMAFGVGLGITGRRLNIAVAADGLHRCILARSSRRKPLRGCASASSITDAPPADAATLARTRVRRIHEAAESEIVGTEVLLKGWVRTVRDQKRFAFVDLNDGSSLTGMQVVVEASLPAYESVVKTLLTGSSIAVRGTVVKSLGKNQAYEVQASEVHLIGHADASYPLQKKRHTFEYLRSIAHLRPRTNAIGAVARVRSALAQAVHAFFESEGFVYLHSPIITASDCEGAGEMFRVTTLPTMAPREDGDGGSKERDDSEVEDFFGKAAFLTVSGQLSAETYACALSDVYTFGPTFRAENSNTTRHLAEFWMIEPEMAFADLSDDIANAEAFVKYVVRHAMQTCRADLEFFDKFVEKGLLDKLNAVLDEPFGRITYTDAITLLKDVIDSKKHKFEFPVDWGIDLATEHERYLAEVHFKKPVFVYNYPAEIKAFYMRANDDDEGRTVAATDLLVPGIGELIGGSQREERLDVLEAKLDALGLEKETYWWYLDLRRYGSVPHSGYGLGFERLVQFVTGMENIRDVIPFPRYPGNAEF